MSNKPPIRKPAAMAEDGDAPLEAPQRPNSPFAAAPNTSAAPAPSLPSVAPSRERPDEDLQAKLDANENSEASVKPRPKADSSATPSAPPTSLHQASTTGASTRAKMDGTLETDASLKARAKPGLRLASGSDMGDDRSPSNSHASAAQRFPHTLNKAPYEEQSVYTSRGDDKNPKHDEHGAFAVKPSNSAGNTSMVDNLMEPQESDLRNNTDVLVAAELASTRRDSQLRAEADQLRQQLRDMQEGQDLVVAVPAGDDDEKTVPPPDPAKQARAILGAIVALCLLVGAIVIGIIFLTPPGPPEPVSDLPCISESTIFPLGLCVGDCDVDTDCQEGLRCFQRNGGEEVPGCDCGAEDSSRTDYCIAIEYPPVRETNQFPLGLCEGDCDSNSDCQQGLVCFQRNRFTAVPGCSGGETDISNSDYCTEGGQLPFLGIFGDRLIGSIDDNFGSSVSLSSDGRTLAVGAVELGSTGYINIYSAMTPPNGTNAATSWIPVATIRGEEIGEAFGTLCSLSADGKAVAVGSVSESRGANGLPRKAATVRVFQASDDLKNWTIVGGDIIGDTYELNGGNFEFSVDLSPDGQYVALGQKYSSTGRGTLVFRNENGDWISLGAPFDGFRTGSGVALSTTESGNVRVAANGENSILGPGQVYVMELGDNEEWVEVGQSLGENDGAAVALSNDGTVLAFSLTNRTSSVGGSGPEHVAVYRLDNSTSPMEWTEMGVIIPIPGGGVSKEPSIALSNDGLLLAIGERWYGNDVGRVRVWKYNQKVDTWEKFDDDIVGEQFRGVFGASISLAQSSEESILAVGAPSLIVDRGARGSVSCYQVLTEENEAADGTFSPTQAPTTSSVMFEEVVFLKGRANREAIGASLALSSDGTTFAYQILSADSMDSVRTIKYDAIENVWADLGTIIGDEVDSGFGRSLAFSGDGSILAIGMPNSNNGTTVNKGRVRVLRYNESWRQIGEDILSKAEDRVECFDGVPVPDDVFCKTSTMNINGGNFGFSISMSQDGSTIAVGSPFGYDEAGQVDVYRFEPAGWVQMGSSIIGPKFQYGKLGWSVSLSSDGLRLATGAITNGQLVEEAGAVRIYEFRDGSWQQIGEDIQGQAPRDLFGGAISLSADGNRVAVGSVNNDNENGSNAGHVRVFDYTPETNWTQSAKPLTGLAAGEQFGFALSLSNDGTKLAVGSQTSSYVRLFEYDTDNSYWRQIGNPLKRPRESGGGFGARVMLADKGNGGLIFAVGAPLATTPVQLGQPDALIGEIHLFEV